MLALGDKGALAPLEAGERPVHMGVKLVLPLGKLRPVAQNFLGGQPPVLGDGRKAQVESEEASRPRSHPVEPLTRPGALLYFSAVRHFLVDFTVFMCYI